MIFVSQQPQQPRSRDGESKPLLQKDSQATSQQAPRPSLLKRVLKVGGALIAIELLVYTLFVLFGPRLPHFSRHQTTDGNEIYGLPHADKCDQDAQWWDLDAVERNRRWSSRSNLTFPPNEQGLYFVTEGAVYGKVELVEDTSLTGEVVVDFYVEYDDWVFGRTRFCTLKDITGTGIGIFGPRYTRKRRSTLAEVTVRFPKLSKPFEVENVVVSAPIFDVHFGDINVKPRTLSVRTSTGDVSVNNIEADASDIRVDTGSIRGNFIVTESLTLRTATGSIIANVSMLSSTTFPQQPPTVASIKTNTGSIDTRFSLFAIDSKNNAQVSSGGFFDVDARSDASSIRVRFDDAPVDSTLVLTSKTSTGPINVDPHPTYEGAFSLSSDVSSPVVSVKDDVEDPAGKDRKRTVKFIHTRNRAMVGEVVWGNAHVDGSRVDLKSDAGTPRLSI